MLMTIIGVAGKYLNQFFESPVFQSPSQEQIAAKLKEAGLASDAKQIVHDGRTGEPFVNPIFVGVFDCVCKCRAFFFKPFFGKTFCIFDNAYATYRDFFGNTGRE